jgi:hypothetical protein
MPNPENMVLLDAEGRPHEMDIETAAHALESPGWRVQTDTDRRSRLAGEAKEEVYGGVGGAIKAGVTGVARGASFGVTDALGDAEEFRNLREVNPGVSLVTELAGSIVAPGGGAAAVAKGAKATSAVGKVASVAARGTGQNIAQGFGEAITEASLSESPLDIERLATSALTNSARNVVLGGAANIAGAAAGKALRVAKGKLDDVVARGAKVEGVAEDLTALDAKGLRKAEATELQAIEQTRVGQRTTVADEIKAHRVTAKDEKLFLATQGAKAWEGVDEALKKEMGVVGKRTLVADRQLDRLLDNPKALAKRPGRALEALQQQESALEAMVARRADLENVFKADTTPTRIKALDAADRALQRNRELQTKLADLASTPTSQRLDDIVSARDGLTTGAKESMGAKMAGGAAYSVGASAVGAIPIIGPLLAPFAGAAASNAITGKLGGALSKATTEAAGRASKAVDAFLTVGGKIAPAAPVLASKVFAAYRYGDGDDDKDEPAPTKARLASTFRKRVDEVKRNTSYVDGKPKARPEYRQQVSARLAPLGISDPVMADRLESLAARKMEYLSSKVPRRPEMASVRTGPDRWQPSDLEMRSFARTMAAVEDPQGVLDRLAHGTVTPEDAQAMREVYPEMMADVTRQILERLPELQKSLPYKRRLALSVFTGAPVDPAMDPRILAVLQASFTDEPGTEGGTQAPKPMPAFGSVKNQDATPSQIRQGA